jgi:hypothetical protein
MAWLLVARAAGWGLAVVCCAHDAPVVPQWLLCCGVLSVLFGAAWLLVAHAAGWGLAVVCQQI